MKRISVISFCFIAAVTALFSLAQVVTACQVDDFYLTKDGHIAGSTPETLKEAVNYQAKGSQEKLAGMINKGVVVRLQNNIKVQAVERSFDPPMIRIKFPDNETPFWVMEGSLKRINCN